jgi:pimeloyl-ACP methyl ester carboxylesterase
VTIDGSLRRRTVRVAGRDRQVLEGGAGPPLLWLHAAGGLDPSSPPVRALARRFTVVAPVAPGFEDLDELADLDDVHDLALHYDDLLDALGLDDADVVGHSFGGMIAAELAAHVPRRVGRLVLLAPVGLWDDRFPVADFLGCPEPERQRLLWGDPSVRAQQAGAIASGPTPEALLARARGLTSVAKFVWPIPDKGLRRRLRRIKARTLIIFGEEDALMPAAYAEQFSAGIPDARDVVLAGAGHMVPVERCDEVIRLIGDFLGNDEALA